MFSAGFPFFACTGSACLAGGGSAAPRWAIWSPGAQRCPLPSVRKMVAVQGCAGPARGAAGQLFQGKRPVVPTRSHSLSFVCFATGGRGAAGACWMPRAAGCGFAGLARSDPHYPCLPGRSSARAARLQSPPVSGAGAGGLSRDLSLGVGRYRLTRANSQPGRLGTAAFSVDLALLWISSLPRKLPTPGLLMGVFTLPSEEAEHPSRLETPRGWWDPGGDASGSVLMTWAYHFPN